MPSLLDSALQLAAQGFRVFPLRPMGRTPLNTGWQIAATTDPAKIREAWTDPIMDAPQPFNIGVATGQGVVVLDIDVKNGKDGERSLRLLEMLNDSLPATMTVRTPSGGRHLYFRVTRPVGNSVQRIAEGIDLRGEGGLVVGPGSVVMEGTYARVG